MLTENQIANHGYHLPCVVELGDTPRVDLDDVWRHPLEVICRDRRPWHVVRAEVDSVQFRGRAEYEVVEALKYEGSDIVAREQRGILARIALPLVAATEQCKCTGALHTVIPAKPG